MSDVTLSIGGKHYTVACAAGQEAHITRLGAMIDSKIASLNGSRSNYDAQNLLFAALFLADELVEAQGQEPVQAGPDAEQKAALALEKVAARLEKLAEKLEDPLLAS
ncbi:cell division protein ZapA [Altererythrobacter sp. GH1-8]|uniref:cell division protein ZapA n=1 Tax=Altererythrobacter sp. GH1-8 TaxID=3349333 RepID=UPI00374DC894